MKWIQNQYTPNPVEPEKNSGEIVVETAGYIPRRDLIENMMLAGLRREAYIESQYMYKDNSLAEADVGMPHDIFMDKLEANDLYKQMYQRQQDRLARINQLRQQKEKEKEVSEATPTPTPTSAPEPAGDMSPSPAS